MLTWQESEGRLSLGGEMVVRFMEDFRNVLWKALNTSAPLEVDLSRVVEVDVAGLQLLLAFLRSRQGLKPTKLTGLPPLVHKALDLTGLAPHYAPFLA